MRVIILAITFLIFLGTAAFSETLEMYFQSNSGFVGGEKVRIRSSLNQDNWIEGLVVSSDFQFLVLKVESDTLSIHQMEIDKLEVSHGKGSHAGTGALIGGTLVGATGLGLGIAMASDDFFDVSGGAIAGVTVVGFAAGSLVGYIVGAVIPKENWEEIERFQVGAVSMPDRSPGMAIQWDF